MMNIFKIGGIDNPSPMVKAIEKYPTVSVVKLTGAVDFNTIPPIENVIKAHREYLDQDIVLDFKEVTHIDTSTLAVLIYIINKMKQRRKELSLINCSDLVREYIKIGKLESIIHVYDTLKDVLDKTDKRKKG